LATTTFGCLGGRPATSIEYQREAGSNEIDVSTVIRIAAGADVKTLQPTTPMRGDKGACGSAASS